ncbi:MAG: lipoprotein [Candidatus Magnetoglobus multicellularis str. Araruama]|uniref:Lipoprotein n=1 Tax=Candidatus Magnetoglobus multicellularis str. Araruama TaxID=890399 RepID=A0A1V1PIB8_9BACT|nr:MAG: lipoprotein [Candidatus Magnetoglobus multicellularis str. Araruama]
MTQGDYNNPLNDHSTFSFDCHPGISCFTDCCNDVEMTLYPYDIILLKNRLNIDSETFLAQFTSIEFDEGCWFPHLTLKMSDKDACPFLTQKGCSVYDDRPFACRAYPLARSVSRACSQDAQQSKYYLVRHDYCRGHDASRQWHLSEWIDHGGMKVFNDMNAQWISIDTILKSYPFESTGMNMKLFRLLFSAVYNLDNFRLLIDDCILPEMNISNELIEKAYKCDIHLMEVGFAFIHYCLTGETPEKD